MQKEEFFKMLRERQKKQRLSVRNEGFENFNFRGMDLSNIDFTDSVFVGCVFDDAKLRYAKLDGADLSHASCRGADFSHAALEVANLRFCDLTNANFSGAFLKHCLLEDAVMDGVATDDRTQYFRLHCPETGAFLGYKTCFNERLVTLLIPGDAARTSATSTSCRTDRARVLKISSFDDRVQYREAVSHVDENFVYRTGEMVFADNFNPDRWRDSTGGIHFWMTREEALLYLTRRR